MLRTLLVPLDGSEISEASLPWAVKLAHDRGVSLTLAQIVPFPYIAGEPWTGGYTTADLYQQMLDAERDAATTYLNAVRERLAGERLHIETAVRPGNPAVEMLDLADDLGASAIVMATHGRGGLKRMALGSVAMQIVSHTDVPVFLIRAETVSTYRQPALQRLLVPLDGSLLAERVLDVAREVASPESTLVLVRVVPWVKGVLGDGAAERATIDEATAHRVTRATSYLDRVAAALRRDGITVETQVLVSESGATVSHHLGVAAMAWDADAIVMSTHGRGGLSGWLLGSVADEVVRSVDRPVLLVSARALAARTTGQPRVGDVMTRDVLALHDDEPLIVALRKLVRRGASGAPVLDANDRIVGVISQRDLLAWQERMVDVLTREFAPTPAEYERHLTSETVQSVMSTPPITIEESASLSAALATLRERSLHRAAGHPRGPPGRHPDRLGHPAGNAEPRRSGCTRPIGRCPCSLQVAVADAGCPPCAPVASHHSLTGGGWSGRAIVRVTRHPRW